MINLIKHDIIDENKSGVSKLRRFDYSSLKEKAWDNEIVGYLSQIHELKGKQVLYLRQKPADIEKLVEIAKIQSTESSNEIEGIRTTDTRQQPGHERSRRTAGAVLSLSSWIHGFLLLLVMSLCFLLSQCNRNTRYYIL